LLVYFLNYGIYFTRRRRNAGIQKITMMFQAQGRPGDVFVVETIEKPGRRLIKVIEFLNKITAERANKL